MMESTTALAQPELAGIIGSLRTELTRVGARRLWLFGSRAGRRAGANSDWDFLVEFAGPPSFSDFMGLKLLLEDRLHGRVDLLSRRACKPRFLEAIQDDLIDVT
jgi:uncharacterized protein